MTPRRKPDRRCPHRRWFWHRPNSTARASSPRGCRSVQVRASEARHHRWRWIRTPLGFGRDVGVTTGVGHLGRVRCTTPLRTQGCRRRHWRSNTPLSPSVNYKFARAPPAFGLREGKGQSAPAGGGAEPCLRGLAEGQPVPQMRDSGRWLWGLAAAGSLRDRWLWESVPSGPMVVGARPFGTDGCGSPSLRDRWLCTLIASLRDP
jgi:hypothetical protein